MTRRGPEGAFSADHTVPRIPGRGAPCDALAGRRVALEAAERELRSARCELFEWHDTDELEGLVLDRYIAALTERNAVRDGRP